METVLTFEQLPEELPFSKKIKYCIVDISGIQRYIFHDIDRCSTEQIICARSEFVEMFTEYIETQLSNMRGYLSSSASSGKLLCCFHPLVRERTIRALLDRLEINIPDLSQPAAYLSGGQRQGLAIARALRMLGKILLLDEPTSAMGIREAHNTMALLQRLKREGLTQLLISHNLHQVFDIADRIFVMRAGRCIADVMTADSSPDEIHAMILRQENQEVNHEN